MSNQMSKASQPPIKVVTSVVEPSEAEKPKKKKKKKTTVTVTEVDVVLYSPRTVGRFFLVLLLEVFFCVGRKFRLSF